MSKEVIGLAELHHGDCLEVMAGIPEGSVDAVICDPPYGTVKGLGDSDGISHGMAGRTGWDDALAPAKFMSECSRLLRTNGSLVLFSQEPYTSRLIAEANGALPFSYRMVWLKDHFANALIAKKAPVAYTEDVLVFRCKKDIDANHDFAGEHPLRGYAELVIRKIGKGLKQVNADLGHRRAEHFFYVGTTQFGLCTEATYSELCALYGLRQMEGFREWADLADVNRAFKKSKESERREYLASVYEANPVVFNLPESAKYKSNVLQYRKDYTGHHPTQKPVPLMEDLVKTYTNPGDTVLDFTMGSGSTGVACMNTGRKFIGIELDDKYFTIACERIGPAQPRLIA